MFKVNRRPVAALIPNIVGSLGTIVVHSNGSPFVLPQPTSNSAGEWTYESSDPYILSIVGNVATPIRTGQVTISARQAAFGKHGAGATTTLATVTM